MRIKYIVLLLISMVMVSCGGGRSTKTGAIINEQHITDEVRYAKLFTMRACEGYKVVEVVNPWDTTKLLQRYLLVNRDSVVPSELPEGKLVRTPVKRAIAYTAVDIGSVEALNLLNKIVGVCEARYILSPIVKKAIANGDIKDLGSYTKPNVEQIMAANAELIFASPFAGQNYGVVETLGAVIGECAGYMERTPLGRCEWLKFYACFFEQELVAQQIFNDIEEKYQATVELIRQKVENRPKLLADKRYGQVWFMSPGNSYAAEFYRSAGAAYPWDTVVSDTALSLSFETVLQQAHDADVWLFGYTRPDRNMTLADLKAEYSSYSLIKAFKTGRVYGCNSEIVPFYEKAPLRPDLVLIDYAKMLHEELFKDYEFTFYQKLSEK